MALERVSAFSAGHQSIQGRFSSVGELFSTHMKLQAPEAHGHDLENPIRSKSPVPSPGMCRKLGPDPLEEVHTLQLGSPGHPQPDCNGMNGWDPLGRENVNGYSYLSNYSLCLSLNYLSIYWSICVLLVYVCLTNNHTSCTYRFASLLLSYTCNPQLHATVAEGVRGRLKVSKG